MQTIQIHVEDIEIGERHRALSEDAVARLSASMKDVGLRSPITIRVVNDYVLPDGEVCDGVPLLVAGAHRLAAAKALGWTHIDCIDVDDDEITAEMWEIAENLHRLDLTKDQRDEHIRRYAELIEAKAVTQKPPHSAAVSENKGGRGNKGIPRQIAEETGLSVDTVRRALNPAPSQPKPVKSDHDVILAQANAIVSAWNRACPEAREMALEQIDGPIFDRSSAAA